MLRPVLLEVGNSPDEYPKALTRALTQSRKIIILRVMIKRLLQKAVGLSKAALLGAIKGAPMGALYFCATTLLAATLVAAYLAYAWNIDQEKLFRAYAILQGIEIAQIQQAERDAAAEIAFERVLAERARRHRELEFQWGVRDYSAGLPGPPVEPSPEPLEDPEETQRLSEYLRRVEADLARARTEGLAEQTRIIEEADVDQAKEIIRRLWNDGQNRRVLQMLMDMEDRPRQNILYAMQETNEEELRDLVDILQRIGDGEPRASIIREAADAVDQR